MTPSSDSSRLSLSPALAQTTAGKIAGLYGILLVFGALAFFGIVHFGNTLPHEAVVDAPVRAGHAHAGELAQILLALGLITISARAAGAFVFRFLRQPPVIGEIAAGILLGPSALGAVLPQVQQVLLPHAMEPMLGVIAKLGVVLFMFIVGLELDTGLLKGNTKATLLVSHASIVVPFVLGAILSLWLYPEHGPQNISFLVFALFCGISMSVTAFPVLARILSDRKLTRTQMGATAIACAAIGDATAWCILAFVSGVAEAQLTNAWRTVALVGVYVTVMIAIVRPLAAKFEKRFEENGQDLTTSQLAVILALMLLSAAATEWIGIHALFGAFLFGAFLPHGGRLERDLRSRLEDLVLVLFVPLFFAFTGLRTRVGLIDGGHDWFVLAVICLVATLGKFGGSFGIARLIGMSWKEASALGILMNTRGLMELIVLNIGRDMGVLTPKLFTMLVLMALLTTFITTPMLDLIGASPAYFRSQSSIPPAPARGRESTTL